MQNISIVCLQSDIPDQFRLSVVFSPRQSTQIVPRRVHVANCCVIRISPNRGLDRDREAAVWHQLRPTTIEGGNRTR